MEPILVFVNNQTKEYGKEINYEKKWAPHHLG